VTLGDQRIPAGNAIEVQPDQPAPIAALEDGSGTASELLMLQGRPIGEPVVQHGPFVANEPQEIQQAFADYRAGAFGRWPWSSDAPTHARDCGRFARHVDGRIEDPRAL